MSGGHGIGMGGRHCCWGGIRKGGGHGIGAAGLG
jgi:hypothetical protein